MLMAWNNGESFTVPYFELRFECPCASCVDEHTGRRTLRREAVESAVRVTGAQLVGRYAVQLSFSDGHATGIFHFDRLFELCEKQGKRISA
jgi:DUF971 family protein